MELKTRHENAISLDTDLIPGGANRSDDAPATMSPNYSRRSMSILSELTQPQRRNTELAEVSDEEVQKTLDYSKKLMSYVYFLLYGVRNVMEAMVGDDAVIVNPWIYRIYLLGTFIVVGKDLFFIMPVIFKGYGFVGALTFGLMFVLVFAPPLFYVVHGINFGADAAMITYVNRSKNEILRSRLENGEKRRLLRYLGYAQLGVVKLFLILHVHSAILVIEKNDLYLAIFYPFGVLFKVYFLLNIHQCLTWSWIIYCRQMITQDETLRISTGGKNLVSREDVEHLKEVLVCSVEDFNDMTKVWGSNWIQRIFMAFAQAAYTALILYFSLIQLDEAVGTAEIIFFVSMTINAFMPIIVSLIITGHVNSAFYIMLTKAAVEMKVDLESSLGALIRKVLLGEGKVGYKILGVYITIKEVVLIATIVTYLYRLAVLASMVE